MGDSSWASTASASEGPEVFTEMEQLLLSLVKYRRISFPLLPSILILRCHSFEVFVKMLVLCIVSKRTLIVHNINSIMTATTVSVSCYSHHFLCVFLITILMMHHVIISRHDIKLIGQQSSSKDTCSKLQGSKFESGYDKDFCKTP